MGNYEELKTAVQTVIKQNGNEEITGQVMQNTLLNIISTIGANATFAGIATPDTAPGTPDQNVFYLAGTPGTYSNFGGYVLTEGLVMFENSTGAFTAVNLGVNSDDVKKKFLADKSIIGMVNIDDNHLFNIPTTGGKDGEYIVDPDNDYDSGWIVIPEYGGKMSVSGATIRRVTFFNDVLPSGSAFISSVSSGFTNITIPDYAKLALVTLLRSANPEGYKNLIVTQPGGAAKRMELDAAQNTNNNNILLLKERLYKNRSFSGKVDIDKNMLVNIGTGGTVVYIPDDEYSTAFVDIFDGSQYLEVTGVNITRIEFFRDYEIN